MERYSFERKRGRRVIWLLSILVFGAAAMGQSEPRPEACKELGDGSEFVVVDENRARLQSELPELRAKAKDLKENKIPSSEKAEKELNETNAKLANPKLATPDLEKIKVSLEERLAGKSVEGLKGELTETSNLISWKELQLKCVNSDIRKLAITPEQSFKGDMSFYFAIIITVLILGFFVMGYLDETVRRGNFSGQTGLQFVTLFSIVIAIILFGITGILEAKELAALLGGLSGYILGRSSTPAASTHAESGSPSDVLNSIRKVASVTISPKKVTLTAAAPTQELRVAATDAQNMPVAGLPNYAFQWISDSPTVATVDQSGLVTWVSVGTCNIKAMANGFASNVCAVTCQ